MTPNVLSIEHLAVDIGGTLALADVSLEVPRGSCTGIVGETGSGKTLTCRVMTGLIGRIGGRAVRGRVTFEDADLLELTEPGWQAIRGREIALVPQASMAGLDPVMRVGRQLEETIARLTPGLDAGARATELLERVHMPRPQMVKRLYPHELSGGMRQRVMIALALTGRPRLLVADESTTALDVTVQRGILALLAELREETGMSVVLVTHDLAVVQSVADRVAVMYAGTVVESGATEQVLAAPAHPYTRALLAARPIGAGRTVLSSIPGTPPALDERPPGCPFQPRCAQSGGRERCRAEEPPLRPVAQAGRRSACHFAEELTR